MTVNIDDLICDGTGVYFVEGNVKIFVAVPKHRLSRKLLACSNGRLLSKATGEYYKTQLNRKGYPRLTLYIDRLPASSSVHRLIASAFIPNPNNYAQVNHIDCNKENNKCDNLEWVTGLENIHHAIDNGLHDAVKRTTLVKDLLTGEIKTLLGIREAEKKYGLGTRRLESHLKSKHAGMYDFNGYAFKYVDDKEWPSIIGPYPGFVTMYAVDLNTGTLHTCDNINHVELLTGIKRMKLARGLSSEKPFEYDHWKIFKRTCKM